MGSMLHSFGIRPTSRHRGGPGRAGAGLVDLVHVCEPWTRLPPGSPSVSCGPGHTVIGVRTRQSWPVGEAVGIRSGI